MGFFIIIPQFKHWLQSQIQRHPADKRNLLEQIYYKFISDGLSPPLGLCLLAQSLWRESNVLDNWQLTMLPLSELCESNPPLGPRQFVGFFVRYRPFPAAREKNNTNIYVCMRACMYGYMHIRMPECLSPCTSRMRLLWYCPIFTVRRITSNTNMLYAKTHFTIKGNI